MLDKINTRAPASFDKKETKEKTEDILKEITSLQNLMFAEAQHSLLIILQGMDASGKDGLIKDVSTSINPMGINVYSFKVPTEEELKHDFLWRVHKCTPEKGKIAIFNRSHYEDVLVTRVHGLTDDATAEKRMKAINNFEKLLTEHNHTHLLKFYLHVSSEEQSERLRERMNNPEKMWKYNQNDFIEAEKRKQYMDYYEDVFKNCNETPWQIIPSDQNWYKCYLVAKAVRDAMKELKMHYPPLKN